MFDKLTDEQRATIEAIIKEEAKTFGICGCGSCNDSIDTALKLVNEMVDNDCVLWTTQVACVIFYASGMAAAGATEQLSPNSSITRDFQKSIMDTMAPIIATRHADFEALRDKVAVQTAQFTKQRPKVREVVDLDELLKSLLG